MAPKKYRLLNKTDVLLNERRWPAILQMMAGRTSLVVDVDGQPLKFVLSTGGGIWAEAEFTPAIQRYLSRIPLAPADDESSSSAEASADALESRESDPLADASEDASSTAGDGEPQAESQGDSAGDLDESTPDVQGEDISSDGLSRSRTNPRPDRQGLTH